MRMTSVGFKARILLAFAAVFAGSLASVAHAEHSAIRLADSYRSSAVLAEGTSNILSATVFSKDRRRVIVDLELFGPGDRRVAQKYFNSVIGAGRQEEFRLETDPGLPAGTYYLSVGIFEPRWLGFLFPRWSTPIHWHHGVQTFRIYDSSPCEGDCEVKISRIVAAENELTVEFESPSSANLVLVDLELHDEDGNRVEQKFWDETSFKKGERKNFKLTTSSLLPGTYELSAGVFYPAWTGTAKWFDKVEKISVE